MDSDPAPKHVRNYIFSVGNTARRKLKLFHRRICQSNRDELKLAAILAQRFPPANFLFDDASRLIIPGKATDEHDCRHVGGSAGDNNGFNPHAILAEADVATFSSMQRQNKSER